MLLLYSLIPQYAVCKEKHKETAFSGDGGLYVEGRWTPKGIKVVYTSESLALASLEVFVHTESDELPLIAICASLDHKTVIEEIKIDNLPNNWQENLHTHTCNLLDRIGLNQKELQS